MIHDGPSLTGSNNATQPGLDGENSRSTSTSELHAQVRKPSVSSILSELKQCSLSRSLAKGQTVHSQAVVTGLCSNLSVGNSLINMYVKCGKTVHARLVFDGMAYKNVVSWTALLQGYAVNGCSELALELFDELETEDHGFSLDARVFVAALSACADLGQRDRKPKRWLARGKAIHSQATLHHCCDIYVESNLVDMYSKCGSLADARKVFNNMAQKNVVSWTALIQGYVDNGESEVALSLFTSMERAQGGCLPNAWTFLAALSACGNLAGSSRMNTERQRWLERGRTLHSLAVNRNCCGIYVETMLVDMYSRCGNMFDARRVFDGMVRRNVVSWNALLTGYVENGECELALELFEGMETSACVPDSRTYIAAISACASLAAGEPLGSERCRSLLQRGEAIHSRAVRAGCCNSYVENTLVSLYGKCGSLTNACRVFERMVSRDSVSWNALIMGYVENGKVDAALELVAAMDVPKDSGTYVVALLACASLMAVEMGESLHAEIRNQGLEDDLMVGNCLMDFYGKCGKMEAAEEVFEAIGEKRTLVSWNTLMTGYSLKGEFGKVFELFEKMEERGVAPDEVTFICLLTACNHAGMTDKGKMLLNAMQSTYGLSPGIKHYTCLVSLLGKSSSLDEALRVVKTMPVEAEVGTWTAILSSCWRT